MRKTQYTDAGEKVISSWPLISTESKDVLVAHLDRVLDWAERRQQKSAVWHRKLRTDQTRKSCEYDTAVVRALKWALYHAQRRPTND